jgi:deoxyribodipyrimidine photo-lyase
MNADRIETVFPSKREGDHILYLMTSSFRTHDNHALEHALEHLHDTNKPLRIALLKPKEEQVRNNDFFQMGIANYEEVFAPVTENVRYVDHLDEDTKDWIQTAHHIVKDRAYLNADKALEQEIQELARHAGAGFALVESDVFVPVRIASPKEEYAASTIRKKIQSKMELFSDPVQTTLDWLDGEAEALSRLQDFILEKLERYTERNDPSKDVTSGLSAYLKYGFISPLTIHNEVVFFEGEATDSFLEELIVRRELAYNFVYYNDRYDQFEGITYPWAYQTMEDHLTDDREYLYTVDDYIHFRTHDPYFNAAMKEMVHLGTMHNYMRMYWAKKIIEWSRTYREAYETAIYLNNYYFYDGNTPNGYTGVAWCFGKHDRAWTERPIFGKLRYMNANGLRRKFDIDAYVAQVERRVSE